MCLLEFKLTQAWFSAELSINSKLLLVDQCSPSCETFNIIFGDFSQHYELWFQSNFCTLTCICFANCHKKKCYMTLLIDWLIDWRALQILALISSSVPPVLLMTLPRYVNFSTSSSSFPPIVTDPSLRPSRRLFIVPYIRDKIVER